MFTGAGRVRVGGATGAGYEAAFGDKLETTEVEGGARGTELL